MNRFISLINKHCLVYIGSTSVEVKNGWRCTCTSPTHTHTCIYSLYTHTHIYTHTYTHTRTHIYTHKHTHTYVRVYAFVAFRYGQLQAFKLYCRAQCNTTHKLNGLLLKEYMHFFLFRNKWHVVLRTSKTTKQTHLYVLQWCN
jgi:hypothetical protein